jgi:predicted nucleotidyltransferase
MAKTAMELTEEELKEYDPGSRQSQIHDVKLKKRAWEAAKQAGEILKGEFGVNRVWVFGSLARANQPFTKWSDIDLAVEGLAPDKFFRAGVRLEDVDGKIPIEIFPLDSARDDLKENIQQEGIEL